MEYETINKETPEMKELISGIKEVSKRTVRSSGEKYTLRGGRSANTFSLVLALCRTIGTEALFPTPKSQGKYSIDSQISTDYCKRIIGDRVSEVDDFLAVSFFFLAMNK